MIIVLTRHHIDLIMIFLHHFPTLTAKWSASVLYCLDNFGRSLADNDYLFICVRWWQATLARLPLCGFLCQAGSNIAQIYTTGMIIMCSVIFVCDKLP